MYEPIRTKSVHSTMAGTTADFPHRSREEELDIQLAATSPRCSPSPTSCAPWRPAPTWTPPPTGSPSR